MSNVGKLLRLVVLACVFAIPFVVLYVSSWAFFPYIVGKNLLFRILVEVAFGSWLTLLLLGGMPKPKMTPITLALSIFVVIVAIADLVGVAPLKSFWSNFERMEGFITLMHSYIYFIVAGSILNSGKLWERFWQVSLAVSVIVGLGALLEIPGGIVRIAGVTGNPIYLAVYALFNIFLASLFLYKSKEVMPRVLYSLFILINSVVLWNTGTRGALLGLVAGVIILALLTIVFARSERHMLLRKISIGVVALVVLLTGIFLFNRDSSFVQNHNMLSRLANVSLSTKDRHSTGTLRLMVWGTALKGVGERPILGWGQENFNYVFNKYYNPRMYEAEQWYDRTHNILLDWLIATGALGLLAYLGIYVATFLVVLRLKNFDSIEKSLLISLLVAYSVHNLFVFDNLISYVLFFSLLAWLHSVFSGGDNTISDIAESRLSNNKLYRTTVLIVVLSTTIISIYLLNYPIYAQNKTLLQAVVTSRSPSMIEKSRELFLDAISYNSVGTQEAREQFIQTASRLAPVKGISDKVKSQFANSALVQMQLQMNEYPNDARFPFFTAGMLRAYGKYDLSAMFLQKALELSPNKISILTSIGNNYALRGDFSKSKEYYESILKLVPDNTLVQNLLKRVDEELRKRRQSL